MHMWTCLAFLAKAISFEHVGHAQYIGQDALGTDFGMHKHGSKLQAVRPMSASPNEDNTFLQLWCYGYPRMIAGGIGWVCLHTGSCGLVHMHMLLVACKQTVAHSGWNCMGSTSQSGFMHVHSAGEGRGPSKVCTASAWNIQVAPW